MKQTLIIVAIAIILGGVLDRLLFPAKVVTSEPLRIVVTSKDTTKIDWIDPKTHKETLNAILNADSRIFGRIKAQYDSLLALNSSRDALLDSLLSQEVSIYTLDTIVYPEAFIVGEDTSGKNLWRYSDTLPVLIHVDFLGSPLNLFRDLRVALSPSSFQMDVPTAEKIIPAETYGLWWSALALYNGDAGLGVQLGYSHLSLGYGLIHSQKPLWIAGAQFRF